MKPFLKWAGNKYPLRNEIVPVLSKPGKRYIEPFVGSGAIYRQVRSLYESHWLNDKNEDLMNVYGDLAFRSRELLLILSCYFTESTNTKETYLSLRKLFNQTPHNLLRSALFIYLNRHGFNGLTRYNSKGEFNVPFGKYKQPYYPDYAIQDWGLVLKQDQPILTTLDFEEVLDETGEGDIIYCDPPYYPTSETSSFTGYVNGWRVGEDDQRLAVAARAAYDRGAWVVVSNSNTQFIRDLYGYREGKFTEVSAKRSIAANGSSRGKVTELLITFQ